MKILILSNTSWRNDNSFGNSFSNIFGGIDNIEIANIFCRYGEPNNSIVSRYFQITEKSLITNLVDKRVPSGKEVFINKNSAVKLNSEEKMFVNHIRKIRLQAYYWVRDFIWLIGRWKSRELKEFVDDYNPDIIFQPLYYSLYLNDIALFLNNYTKVPMVCYVSDDNYTLHQFSLSPLYWVDRFMKRIKIKKVIEHCEYMYVISDIQKREYEKCFKKECRVLTKGADFLNRPPLKEKINIPMKFVYTGNIGGNRWKSLALIGKALEKINNSDVKAQLYIYSMTPITGKMQTALNIASSAFFMGGVSQEKIKKIQREADVLVHVEPLDLSGRLAVHQSFSTKIVDYFHAARCIFAVGTADTASINYLIKNDAAIVAITENQILDRLNEIINHLGIVNEYAEKSWDCGKRNHQIGKIQDELFNDLKRLLKEEN